MKKLVPKAITFDVYGTILDSHGAWERWFEAYMIRKGITNMTPKEAVSRWEKIQFTFLDGEFLPHYDLKKASFRKFAEEVGWKVSDDEVEEFSHGLDNCKPFADSKEAIAELRKYTKVCTLTNCCNKIVTDTFDREGIVVDEIMTSDDARAYKPSHEVFKYSQKRLGLTQDEILHCAFGFLYDIVPATALGYRTVWINRLGIVRPADCRETYLCGDIQTLALIMKGFASVDAENGF